MRSLSNQKQKVWFSDVEEVQDGIDTVFSYSKPELHKLTVSQTSGTPEEISAGIVPDYDRYITYHKPKYGKRMEAREGMAVWVDVEPEIDKEGNLILEEDGITPVTPSDYILKRIIDTKKGSVARYGIVRVAGDESCQEKYPSG